MGTLLLPRLAGALASGEGWVCVASVAEARCEVTSGRSGNVPRAQLNDDGWFCTCYQSFLIDPLCRSTAEVVVSNIKVLNILTLPPREEKQKKSAYRLT